MKRNCINCVFLKERKRSKWQKDAKWKKEVNHFSQKSKFWMYIGSWDHHTWWQSKIDLRKPQPARPAIKQWIEKGSLYLSPNYSFQTFWAGQTAFGWPKLLGKKNLDWVMSSLYLASALLLDVGITRVQIFPPIILPPPVILIWCKYMKYISFIMSTYVSLCPPGRTKILWDNCVPHVVSGICNNGHGNSR